LLEVSEVAPYQKSIAVWKSSSFGCNYNCHTLLPIFNWQPVWFTW